MTYSYGPMYISNLVEKNFPSVGFNFALKNKEKKVVFGPDSYELLMSRCARSTVHSYRIRAEASFAAYRYSVRRHLNLQNVEKLLVFGIKDAAFINERRYSLSKSPIAKFIRHPIEGEFFQKLPKQNFRLYDVLISGSRGRYGEFYCGDWPARFIKQIQSNAELRKLKYIVVGRDYEQFYDKIADLVDVDYFDHVDSYRQLLESVKVYIAFDVVGVGTKNRILQCLARGTKVVGTYISFENIEAPRELKFQYDDINVLPDTVLSALDKETNYDIDMLHQFHSEEFFLECLRNEL